MSPSISTSLFGVLCDTCLAVLGTMLRYWGAVFEPEVNVDVDGVYQD